MITTRNLMRNQTVYICFYQKMHFVKENCKLMKTCFKNIPTFEILIIANLHQCGFPELICHTEDSFFFLLYMLFLFYKFTVNGSIMGHWFIRAKTIFFIKILKE